MATVLVSTTAQTHTIKSSVPFQVYLQPFVDGCKVQFTDPDGNTDDNAVWQDLPGGSITQNCPIVDISGGDDIVYRILAPNTNVVAKKLSHD